MYIYKHIYIYICVYIYIYVHTYTHTCTYKCTYTHIICTSGKLREDKQRKAAIRIQKTWRGHDDRALYSVALSHFRSYKNTRTAAVVVVQRAARRWLGRVFGLMYRERWHACVEVQKVWRGHRARTMQDSSLRIKYVQLQSEMKWMRDVEMVRLERSVHALQVL